METKNATICPKCFNKISDKNFCAFCGNNLTEENPSSCLNAFTFIKERYIVGKCIRQNGEHIIYVGYDVQTKQKVFIKEYMPSLICERQSDGNISVVYGNEAQYKSLLSDFHDLNQRLRKAESDIVIPIIDIIGENNTIYVITKHEDYITLHEYVKQNGGELNWEQTKRLFFPFIRSLEELHKKNIIHRGISPQTVILNKSGKLLLSSFSLACTRTLKSEIEAELFEGYSAPEQYSLKSWQGNWTDVYSLGAVLYRCLTGTRPLHSLERFKKDFLLQADHLNPNIPEFVSNTISKAMIVKSDQRFQSLGVLLLYLQDEVLKVKQNKKSNPILEKLKSLFNLKLLFTSMGITLGVLLLIGFFVFKSIYSDQIDAFFNNTSSDTSQTTSISTVDGITPNLVGSSAESVLLNKTIQKKYRVEQVFEYNEEYPSGIVFEQYPLADTPIDESATITIKVSKGSEYILVPNIIGMDLDTALDTVVTVGIPDYSVQEVDQNVYIPVKQVELVGPGDEVEYVTVMVPKDPQVTPGIVLSVFPDIGQKVSIRTGKVHITCQTKDPTPPPPPVVSEETSSVEGEYGDETSSFDETSSDLTSTEETSSEETSSQTVSE